MSNEYLDAEFIPIDIEPVLKTEIDTKTFRAGLDYGTYLAGISTALFNSGFSEDNVTEIIKELISSDSLWLNQ